MAYVIAKRRISPKYLVEEEKQQFNPIYSSEGFILVRGVLLPQNRESTEFSGGLYLVDPLLETAELTQVRLQLKMARNSQGLEGRLILPYAHSRLQKRALPQVRLEYFQIEEIQEETQFAGIISTYVPLPESREQFELPMLYCAIDRQVALPKLKIRTRR